MASANSPPALTLTMESAMTRATRKSMFGSRQREAIWCREATNAYIDGRGHFPICNICDQPVHPQEDWDISHDGVPRAFGGKLKGVGHRDCNRRHGSEVVVPFIAKTNAMHDKHIGVRGPGLGRHPMRAGRRSHESKTFEGGLVARLTLSEKIARMRARRAVLPLSIRPGDPVGQR